MCIYIYIYMNVCVCVCVCVSVCVNLCRCFNLVDNNDTYRLTTKHVSSFEKILGAALKD